MYPSKIYYSIVKKRQKKIMIKHMQSTVHFFSAIMKMIIIIINRDYLAKKIKKNAIILPSIRHKEKDFEKILINKSIRQNDSNMILKFFIFVKKKSTDFSF